MAAGDQEETASCRHGFSLSLFLPSGKPGTRLGNDPQPLLQGLPMLAEGGEVVTRPREETVKPLLSLQPVRMPYCRCGEAGEGPRKAPEL